MYANVVLDLDGDILEHILEQMKHNRGVTEDTGLTAEDLKELVGLFKIKVKE
jgi:pyruvate,orthophosphate dikinase